jgi:hypothetical protein
VRAIWQWRGSHVRFQPFGFKESFKAWRANTTLSIAIGLDSNDRGRQVWSSPASATAFQLLAGLQRDELAPKVRKNLIRGSTDDGEGSFLLNPAEL